MWAHKCLVPAVPVTILRRKEGEVLLWFKAAQDQDKGGQFLTITYRGEILKLSWEGKGALPISRPVALGRAYCISSLHPALEKKGRKEPRKEGKQERGREGGRKETRKGRVR